MHDREKKVCRATESWAPDRLYKCRSHDLAVSGHLTGKKEKEEEKKTQERAEKMHLLESGAEVEARGTEPGQRTRAAIHGD